MIYATKIKKKIKLAYLKIRASTYKDIQRTLRDDRSVYSFVHFPDMSKSWSALEQVRQQMVENMRDED